MIPKYDSIEQSVRLYEAKLKGKMGQNTDAGNLTMNLIIEKNKKIDHDNRLQKLRVIRARKLRIKISEVFNNKILKNDSFFGKSLNNRGHLTSSNLQFTAKKITKSSSTMRPKRLFSQKTLQQSRKNEKQRIKLDLLKNQGKQQTGGMINLFEKFTEQEISQIQSDQSYFLITSELIELFRKYITKKRMNNKDTSYENFMLRKKRGSLQEFGQKWNEMSSSQMKKYVLQRIGSTPSHEKTFRSHLLTNPLSIEFPKSKTDSKQHKQQHPRIALFQQLKRKQMQNEQRLIIEREKKRRKLRIDICYDEGIATEVRAIQLDKRKKRLSERNILQSRRSIDYRNKIAFVNDNYGNTVELAEQVRKEFIRNRKIKRKQIER